MPLQPIFEEIDWRDPVTILASRGAMPGTVLLDSAMPHPLLGRWSYLAFEPFGHFTVRAGRASWNGNPIAGAPIAALRGLMRRFALPHAIPVSPFTAGATGFFAYEAGRLFENLPEPRPARLPCPEIELWFHDAGIAFDGIARRAFLVATGFPEDEVSRQRTRQRERIERLRDAVHRAAQPSSPAAPLRIPRAAWRSNMGAEAFRAAVARTRDYISAGDIFQANIAQRFSADIGDSWDPVAAYAQVRAANPATFGAFLMGEDREVLSTSPERFLLLRDGAVETRPIKGTRRRSLVPEEDRALAADLLQSEKDRAENIMIVDLLRNDLSRVSKPGTVQVPILCGLESYASVHHLVSVVTGRLREGLDALDLLAASFPGGSITGAPKIRAMEIIHELEPDPRGVYCGSILHLGFDGSLHSNIAIRTLVREGRHASFHVGGGITLLSDPDEEHTETLVKAERLFQAFDPD